MTPDALEGRAAAALLVELLQRSCYRQRWLRRVRRRTGAAINVAAVSDVIASHLWDIGERSDTEWDLARRLRDRIRRALNGEALSASTVTWFIAAFEFDPADEEALWAAYASDAGVGKKGGGAADRGSTSRPCQGQCGELSHWLLTEGAGTSPDSP